MKRVASRASRRRRRPGRRGQAFIEGAERDESVVPFRCTHIHISHEHVSYGNIGHLEREKFGPVTDLTFFGESETAQTRVTAPEKSLT